ncbi:MULTISPECIES: hypothetical protein [pseudomallei group]|uniref:hypothetical protein n=1 Tax=pseudomallei group TaxID=111527 RepID=UPI00117771A6|nr:MULTISPECIES: hypothetical protein [pseudomallei group]
MKHLLEALAGMGLSLNAFGSFPQYEIPRRGDQARDFEAVGADMRRVAARVERQSYYCLTGKNGATNNGTGEG